MNYQLDQNRAFNYHCYRFFPHSSVKGVILDGQHVMCASHAILMIFVRLLPSAILKDSKKKKNRKQRR
jgi:hypothetical protein